MVFIQRILWEFTLCMIRVSFLVYFLKQISHVNLNEDATSHSNDKCLFRLPFRRIPLYERPQEFGQNTGSSKTNNSSDCLTTTA